MTDTVIIMVKSPNSLKRLLRCTFFSILLFSFYSNGAAQTGYNPVFTNIYGIINVSWSADSKSLIFQEYVYPDIGVQSTEANTWHQYILNSIGDNELLISSIWPQPLVLPQGISSSLHPIPNLAADYEGRGSFTFLSPNDKYMVYAAEKPADWGDDIPGWPLAVMDLRKSTVALVPDVVIYDLRNFENFFKVRWSDDGTAFTIEYDTLGADHRTYYIIGFAENVQEVMATRLEILSDTGEPRYYGDSYDLTSDGSKVLAISGGWLFVWNPEDRSQIELIYEDPDESVVEAMFSPFNEQVVWFITRSGLMQHDTETNTTTVLEPNINTNWVDKAWFSPDGRYVALYEQQNQEEHNLYVVELPTG